MQYPQHITLVLNPDHLLLMMRALSTHSSQLRMLQERHPSLVTQDPLHADQLRNLLESIISASMVLPENPTRLDPQEFPAHG